MTLEDVRQKLENDVYVDLPTFRDDMYKVFARGLNSPNSSVQHKRGEEVSYARIRLL